jgi:hypothetical protein
MAESLRIQPDLRQKVAPGAERRCVIRLIALLRPDDDRTMINQVT